MFNDFYTTPKVNTVSDVCCSRFVMVATPHGFRVHVCVDKGQANRTDFSTNSQTRSRFCLGACQ